MTQTLFRLPTPRRFEPSREQLALMDLIALHENEPLGDLAPGPRGTLRRLIALELIACIALGPARYMLTPVGRLVRERAMRKGRKEPDNPQWSN